MYNIRGFSQFTSLRSEFGGGGIVAFVKDCISTSDVKAVSAKYEKLTMMINVDGLVMRLLLYYRAPMSENLDDFLDDLESEIISTDVKTAIAGDININNDPNSETNVERRYIELLSSYGYKITNDVTTRPASGRIIDHFITNFHDKLSIANDTLEVDPSVSDHNIVISTLKCPRKIPRAREFITREKIVYKTLQQNFPDLSASIYESNNSDEISNILTRAIQSATKNSSTIKKYSVKHPERINEWTSEKALELIVEKDKLLKKHRRKPHSTLIKENLDSVSAELDKRNKTDYAKYVRQKVTTNDPKKMWRNLNSILGREKDRASPTVENSSGEPLPPKEAANVFNEFFSTCAKSISEPSDTPEEQRVEHQPSRSMILEPPDESEIRRIIKGLKNNSAAGHDRISPKVIKHLATCIAPLLVHLIATIFATGIYPSTLKLAVVSPIYKNGSRSCPDNYRPISVLSILNKIVEKVIHNRLQNHVTNNLNLIYSHQFGFRPRSGTENAAIELSNMIMRGVDSKKIVTGIFMDLRKAFDIVDHKLLLQVLNKYGLRGKVLDLFTSYLEHRSQVVKIGDITSKAASILSGVVQGSCLGPLLFLIFINAIGALKVSGKIFLFADDAVLINIHEKTSSIVDTMRKDMKPILDFFKHRGMVLNSAKTNFMLFTSSYSKVSFPQEIDLFPNLSIKRVASCKYLGFYIDEWMRWTEHIKNLEKKLAPANGILWKLRHILPAKSKKLVYDALVQSQLSFMSPIWGLASCQALKNAQVLQNRALRNVYELPRLTNRINMYTHLVESHLPLRGICLLNIASYMFNATHNLTLSNIDFNTNNNRKLRNANALRPAAARTNYGVKSIESIGPRVFNKVPAEIKSSRHQHAFKWTFRCHLRNESFIASCFDASFFDLKI